MIAWCAAIVVCSIIIGGVGAALIALANGSGFSEAFLQKWRAVSVLFLTFFLASPLGGELGRSLKRAPRFPRALTWIVLALAGTAAFAAAGPFVGKLFDGQDPVVYLYALIFLLGVAGTAASAVFDSPKAQQGTTDSGSTKSSAELRKP
jgi:drug/metabolite transporter (DMT)-like permease